jgi:hypothetical protein
MPEELYRITVDDPNYSNVLESPIKPKEEGVELLGVEGDAELRLWAIRPGPNNEKLYQKMDPGDGLLFYLTGKSQDSGKGGYVAVGRVGTKTEAGKDEAETLFRTSVATRMYTVEDFQKVPLSKEETENLLGYSRHPQGPQRVTDDRYDTVRTFFEKATSSEH